MLDVLVVGAGPSGLLMASELARYGLKCRIIDRSALPTQESKAIVIQARTLEMFDHIGVIDSFLEKGIRLQAVTPISRGHPLAHVSFAHLPSPYPFVLSLEQRETEALLTQHLTSFGLTIEREVELTSFQETAEGIQATLRSKSGQEELLPVKWLIGCDGAHSIVRKSLEFSFTGKAFKDVFSLADLYIDWDYPENQLFAFLDSQGFIVAFPIPGKKRYRLIFQLDRCRNQGGEKELPPPTLEETQALLQRYAGASVRLHDPVWMTNFHINSRMTSSYRKDHLFLVGDAAHIHSPVGGQGMNTGLQDAFNLAWKLAFVHQRRANDRLLDTYNLERHGFGKKLLEVTEKASHLATLRNPILLTLRNCLISTIARFSFVQNFLTRIISQTAIRYPKSLITRETGVFGGPKVGMRAPDATLGDTSLYTLFRKSTCFHILLFTGPKPDPGVIEECSHFAEEKKAQLILIRHPQLSLARPQGILDLNGTAHRLYGASERTLFYCLRPDIYIGCKTEKLLKLKKFLLFIKP